MSPRIRQLLEMSTVESQLADEFGETAFARLGAHCAQCNRPLAAGYLRGLVIPARADVCTVEAAGVCPTCKSVTAILYQAYRDGTIRGANPARTSKAAPMHGFIRGILENMFQPRP